MKFIQFLFFAPLTVLFESIAGIPTKHRFFLEKVALGFLAASPFEGGAHASRVAGDVAVAIMKGREEDYLPIYTNKIDTSEGFTPEIRDACPIVLGRILESFSLASEEREVRRW